MKKELTLLIIFLIAAWVFIWLTTFDGLQIIRYRCYRLPVCPPFAQFLESPRLVRLPALTKFFDPFFISTNSKLSPMPTYNLSVNPDDYQKLIAQLPRPYSSYFLPEIKRKEVPATFADNQENYQVKISLRGLNVIHWSEPKKSLNTKFTPDQLFKNYRQLNFNVPSDSSYFGMFLKSKTAKKLDLPVEDWFFANLLINDINYGLFVVIEPWNQFALEKRGLPNGFIFGDIDPSPDRPPLYKNIGAWKTYGSPFEPVDFSSIEHLLKSLNSEDTNIKTEELINLIDIDSFAKWEALSIFLNSRHQDNLHNIRLFLNPASGKLQFLPVDIAPDLLSSPNSSPSLLDINYNPLVTALLKIPEVRANRDNQLKILLNDHEFINNLWQEYDSLYQNTRSAFYQDSGKMESNLRFEYVAKQLKRNIQENINSLQLLLNENK